MVFVQTTTGTGAAVLTEAGVDVKAASGVSSVWNAGGPGRIAWLADLTALAGGVSPDVTFTWEHSPDNSTWYAIASETALSAVGTKQRLTGEHTFQYLRISWATTGAPTTATATFIIQSAR